MQGARGDKIDGLEAASVLKRSKKEKQKTERRKFYMVSIRGRLEKEEVMSVRFGLRMEI